MRKPKYSALVCLCAGLLLAGIVPTDLHAQTQNPSTKATTPNAQTKSSGKSASAGQQADLQDSAEQIALDARNLQQSLQEHLAGLQDEIANGNFMSEGDLAKLKAFSEEFASEKAALETRAEELGGRAHALAAQAEQQAVAIQNQAEAMPPMEMVMGDEDDSGWLGIEIQEVTSQNAKDLKLKTVKGVVVQGVEPDGPAAKAGLKEDDVITEYDGQVVEGTLQFRRLVRETPPGRSVSMTISRDGTLQTLTVQLGDRAAAQERSVRGAMRDTGNSYWLSGPGPDARFFAFGPDAFDRTTPRLGIEAEDLSGQLGAYFNAPQDSGILVRSVNEGTPAAKAGLKAGDVITSVNGKEVKTLWDLREQLRSNASQKAVQLGVVRKGSPVNLTVEVEKPQPATNSQIIRRAQM
ncbi:MAG TPA: PDZ domain-containing protein [Candidatus Acidoferrum sp.]|nr:PDZ domain-containing protein [Candidatus Acidoferrum sp.]